MNELVPEYYGDVLYLRNSAWGFTVTFAVSSPKEGFEEHDVCTVRLSHETAKTLSMMIRKQLKQYEMDMKVVITIPQDVMNKLGLTKQDW
jgi:DNA-binding transcriptional regulator/RsmH inhibitor MraZ